MKQIVSQFNSASFLNVYIKQIRILAYIQMNYSNMTLMILHNNLKDWIVSFVDSTQLLLGKGLETGLPVC